jgi:hypothetical protein
VHSRTYCQSQEVQYGKLWIAVVVEETWFCFMPSLKGPYVLQYTLHQYVFRLYNNLLLFFLLNSSNLNFYVAEEN